MEQGGSTQLYMPPDCPTVHRLLVITHPNEMR